MPRTPDPELAKLLAEKGITKGDYWDCHGTWVVYHRALERVAAKAGIKFDVPQSLELNGREKIVALCVVGRIGERMEWSIGEAAPYNNKNAYPYAMAEKRAKDRVILKLIGLHGLVYSEDEMAQPEPNNSTDDRVDEELDRAAKFKQWALKMIASMTTRAEMMGWWNSDEQKAARQAAGLTQADVDGLKDAIMDRLAEFKKEEEKAA